jgi:hypothetical protein
MGLKRKHSSNDSTLSISSFGAVTTMDAQSPMSFSKGYEKMMDADVHASSRSNAWDFMSVSRVKSNDWGNRTRKRVRDNRPDEQAIHSKAYSMTWSNYIMLILYQKTRSICSSPRNVITLTPRPSHPTHCQHTNNPLRCYRNRKNQRCILSGNSSLPHLSNPSSQCLYSRIKLGHNCPGVKTAIHRCRVNATRWM